MQLAGTWNRRTFVHLADGTSSERRFRGQGIARQFVKRYETPVFELGQQIREMLATATTSGQTARAALNAGSSKTRDAIRLLSRLPDPETAIWRALVALDRRLSVTDSRPDPRASFMLVREMGRTTTQGMAMADRARTQLPKEWARVRGAIANIPKDVELLRSLLTWMPRDEERREMFIDLNEISEKFLEWFDELSPGVQRGAPRASETDPARRFAGWVFASLRERGFLTRDLFELVEQSATVWKPAPITAKRMRELRKGRVLRDLLAKLVKEGRASLNLASPRATMRRK